MNQVLGQGSMSLEGQKVIIDEETAKTSQD